MAEETENNEGVEEPVETPEAVEAGEEASASEAPEATASEADTAAPAEPEASAPAAEPEPVLAPKERRQRARAAKAAKAGRSSAPRTAEERQAERDAERARKAAARRAEREHARAKHRESAHERSATPPREHEAGRPKTRQGIVVSDKAAKTITVRIDIARRHRRYQKIVRTSSTLHAHDEQGEAHIGDTVIVRECRPLSRTKRWRLVQVVERAE
jgi:small subunit ribosomal protein S17